jgi:sugar porter (SP) family MFS transporter
MYKICSIAALAGLLFGYDTGIISGAIFFIKSHFALDVFMTEAVVAAVLLGAAFGSISSAKLANVLGRKKIIEVNALVFMTSTLISAFANNILFLILGRLGVGFAIGIACYIAPLYISELAPARYRGGLVALNTIAVTGGIFISYLIGFFLSPIESWRWMLGLGVIPAMILWIGVRYLPESPRWLVKQGHMQKAQLVLAKIRGSKEAAETEILLIQSSLKEKKPSWRELLRPGIRKVVVIGIVLAMVQQLTGINTILYYAPLLFQAIGFQSISAMMLLTLGVGFINFLMTIFVMLRVDKMGRRPLLLWGLFGMTLSLLVLSCSLRFDLSSSWVIWTMIASLFAFVATYASSIGCVFWIVIAEIYPLHVRGLAMGVASSANWGANLLITMTFLSLLESLGPSNTFLCYDFVCLLSFVFCYRFLPETAQESLEEIESKVFAQ